MLAERHRIARLIYFFAVPSSHDDVLRYVDFHHRVEYMPFKPVQLI